MVNKKRLKTEELRMFQVNIFVTKKEKEKLISESKKYNRTLSSFCRIKLLEGLS
jgi:hypothetical protein